jgi:hypothetical protein
MRGRRQGAVLTDWLPATFGVVGVSTAIDSDDLEDKWNFSSVAVDSLYNPATTIEGKDS